MKQLDNKQRISITMTFGFVFQYLELIKFIELYLEYKQGCGAVKMCYFARKKNFNKDQALNVDKQL